MKTNALRRYHNKLKYVKVDFYLKDQPAWDYILYLRENGVSIAAEMRQFIYDKMDKDNSYKDFVKNSQKPNNFEHN